jgi:hypothetical protein
MDMLSASWGDDKIAWYENTVGQGNFSQTLTHTFPMEEKIPILAKKLLFSKISKSINRVLDPGFEGCFVFCNIINPPAYLKKLNINLKHRIMKNLYLVLFAILPMWVVAQNNCLDFDGVNDYVNCGNNAGLNPTAAITVEVWINSSTDGWTYKNLISLSPVTPKSDYQVKVNLTTSNFDYSKVAVNGNDLRFYQEDGTSLDYWIEDWDNSGTSIIWVMVVNSGTSAIIMFYGNSAAGAQSNFDKTFPAGNRYILTTGTATLDGSQKYDWFEVQSGATLYITSNLSLKIIARKIKISGTINGNGRGFPNSTGTGAGDDGVLSTDCGGGAGYGGDGGDGYTGISGGTAYGTSGGTDIEKGSGGGDGNMVLGGAGGGAISMEACDIDITGNISLDGVDGQTGMYIGSGGGSGGGILIEGRFVRYSSTLSVEGGKGGGTDIIAGGGGGGGRIKIFYETSLDASGSLVVTWGTSGFDSGDAGTTHTGTFTSSEPGASVGNETAAGISKSGAYGIGTNTTTAYVSINNQMISGAISSV